MLVSLAIQFCATENWTRERLYNSIVELNRIGCVLFSASLLIPDELKKSCFTGRRPEKESSGALTRTSSQDGHVVLPNCFMSTKSLSQTLQQVKYHQHQVSNKPQDTLVSNTNLAFSLWTLFQINQHPGLFFPTLYLA